MATVRFPGVLKSTYDNGDSLTKGDHAESITDMSNHEWHEFVPADKLVVLTKRYGTTKTNTVKKRYSSVNRRSDKPQLVLTIRDLPKPLVEHLHILVFEAGGNVSKVQELINNAHQTLCPLGGTLKAETVIKARSDLIQDRVEQRLDREKKQKDVYEWNEAYNAGVQETESKLATMRKAVESRTNSKTFRSIVRDYHERLSSMALDEQSEEEVEDKTDGYISPQLDLIRDTSVEVENMGLPSTPLPCETSQLPYPPHIFTRPSGSPQMALASAPRDLVSTTPVSVDPVSVTTVWNAKPCSTSTPTKAGDKRGTSAVISPPATSSPATSATTRGTLRKRDRQDSGDHSPTRKRVRRQAD